MFWYKHGFTYSSQITIFHPTVSDFLLFDTYTHDTLDMAFEIFGVGEFRGYRYMWAAFSLAALIRTASARSLAGIWLRGYQIAGWISVALGAQISGATLRFETVTGVHMTLRL
jgi:hypothetical protein